MTCCWVGCSKAAVWWIGQDDVDSYTHSCDDHKDALTEEGDRVVPM